MRAEPSILHVDLDAFFAAVEQLDKPSLRGRPVVVGGIGPRGVVATASYEARRYGVHSAMSTAEARVRCPRAAFLAPRFDRYRTVSTAVMSALRARSRLVEPISLDEAFADLMAGDHDDLSPAGVRRVAEALRADIHTATGLTASVGAATSKLLAKIASDLDKPDGLVVVTPGTERDLLRSLPVRRLWGVGPATAERLRRLGVATVADLERLTERELVDLLGQAHGSGLWRLARGLDDRAVVPVHESKSVSAEDTFARDVTDPVRIRALLDRLAVRVAERLRRESLAGRTVTVKVRLADFTTLSRSATLPAPTDDPQVVRRLARRLVDQVRTTDGVRLLGVGVSTLADWTQDDLFPARDDEPPPADEPPPQREWAPGEDVVHTRWGPGWVQGSGVGRVTVRFETRDSDPGPIRTFAVDDPELAREEPPDQR